MSLIEKTIINIETENGEKTVHFLGYGYKTDNRKEKPFRFVEYCGFYAPIKTILNEGLFSDYEAAHCEDVKQNVSENSETEINNIYATYDNGEKPIEIGDLFINEDTPEGCYVVIPYKNEIFVKEKYPKTHKYVIENLVKGIRCNICGSPVLKSELPEKYKYQCMSCDEDLYGIETHNGKDATPQELNDLFLNTRDILLLDNQEE